MDYVEAPMYHHFQPEPLMRHMSFNDSQHNMHSYALVPVNAMLPLEPAKQNETKPRLGKDEVNKLEDAFQLNHKPSTQTKRAFAEEMKVELARINNWFQNRRAKRKQEKKQEQYEKSQSKDSEGYSEEASPDYDSSYFEPSMSLPESTHGFPMMSGPPPPAASYNPQYDNKALASMQSLNRTMAQAEAAKPQNFEAFLDDFQGGVSHGSLSSDSASFPVPNHPHLPFGNNPYAFGSESQIFNLTNESMPELHHTAPPIANSIMPIRSYSISSASDQVGNPAVATFPSQLLPSHAEEPQIEGPRHASPEETNAAGQSVNYNYNMPDSSTSGLSPPAFSIPFKRQASGSSIASRRGIVKQPAALNPDTLKSRPGMPRSNTEGFRRPNESVGHSGAPSMRRVVSHTNIGGGKNVVVHGRIQKQGVDSAQRSPVNFNGFQQEKLDEYMSGRNMRQASTTSLAPPTPSSAGGQESFAQQMSARSTASPVDGNMNMVYQNTPYLSNPNLASPPETPQHFGSITSMPGWGGMEDKWASYDVSDDPLFTPATDSFQPDVQHPRPSYLYGSQPVTPAFGQFNPSFMMGESPHFKSESPQYGLSSPADYTSNDGIYCSGTAPISPLSKPKQFQFSNTTSADFSESK